MDLRFEFTIVVWCYDLTSRVCRSLCRLSALIVANRVNAKRAGVTRNRSQHFEWPCWEACQKERERQRGIWFVRDNIKPWPLWKCRRVSAHLALRTILVQAYMTTNNKKTDPKKAPCWNVHLAALTDGFMRNQAHPSKAKRLESLNVHNVYSPTRNELISARWSRPLSNIDEKWWFQRLGLGC